MGRFVHTSDWALGSPYEFAPGSVADKLRLLKRKSIEMLMDKVILVKDCPDVLLITGNLFNEAAPSLPLLKWVRSLLLVVKKRGIAVCILRGPQDPVDGSWAEGTGAHIFCDETRMDVGKFKIHALPPQPARRTENLLRRLPQDVDMDILLAFGHIMENGANEAEYHPFRGEDLISLSYPYIALGGRSSLRVFKTGPSRFAAYAGSPFASSFGKEDLGARFCVLGSIQNGEVVADRFRLGVPQFGALQVDCTDVTPEDLLAIVKKDCRSANLLRISLTGTPDLRMFLFRETLRKALSKVIWLDLETHFQGIDLGNSVEEAVRIFAERVQTMENLNEKDRQMVLEIGVGALLNSRDV